MILASGMETTGGAAVESVYYKALPIFPHRGEKTIVKQI